MILTVTLNPSLDKVYIVDDFEVGKVFRPKHMTATAGGKGVNVSRVAALLGAPVAATGLIGGSTGNMIARDVASRGILDRFVRIAGETRTCINVVDQKHATSTEILEPGPVVTEGEIQAFLRTYDELLDECDIVVASGSLPKGLPMDFYCELLRKARRKGKRFILDTSGAFLKEAIKETPFMIKPNKEELSQVWGETTQDVLSCASVLRSFREQGIHLPVLTMGKDGCLAALSDGVYRFSAPPIEVVNTVGSGDSFVAGVAVALSRGLEEVDAITLGMACGMANTQFLETGMISRELVDEFRSTVTFEKIANY